MKEIFRSDAISLLIPEKSYTTPVFPAKVIATDTKRKIKK